WIRPQAFLRYDHHHQRTVLFAYQDASLLDVLESALVFDPTPDSTVSERSSINGSWRLSAEEYQQAVTRIQKQIDYGDAAGICFTETFRSEAGHLDGLQSYLRLRSRDPTPYPGYLRFNTIDDKL